jgi:long-chain acyl-CoA synthetase
MAAQGYEIDLNNVIPALKKAGSNYFEFYDGAGLTRKSMPQLRDDVRAAVSALARLGLPPRARVGILASTSYQWIIVDLACLASGFLTVPFDPEVSWDRDQLAQSFELHIILTNHPEFIAAGGGFVSFEDICGHTTDDGELESSRWADDEPFTAIFTSGTTGEPKVIEVQKRCFDDQFSNALRMFEITPRDKIFVFLPMHIYLERCYVYVAILQGFNVVVASTRFVVKALKSAEFTFAVGIPHFFTTLQDLFLMQIQSDRKTRFRCRARLLLFRLSLGFVLRSPFAPFQKMLGGKARFFLTGSAPCPLPTLQFYHAMGIPIFEGYGMSEIAGMIALNYPRHTRLGTVGKVFPNKEVKLDAIGQILVRGKNAANTSYWRASQEVNAATFAPDGWVATGDVGHFDSDGYLTLTGRIKDVIVLSNGRKVQPGVIEAEINRIEFVDYSVVVGSERPYLVALVSVKASNVDETRLKECFRRLNQSRPEAERVRRYHILTERFTAENGLLSRALKLNRKRIEQHYASLIDNLYMQ